MSIMIANLRTEFVLEAPVDTPDDAGGFDRQWILRAHVHGHIKSMRGAQQFTANAEEATIEAEIILRWRDDVVAGMRLRTAGRILPIVSVTDPDDRHRFLHCRCVFPR